MILNSVYIASRIESAQKLLDKVSIEFGVSDDLYEARCLLQDIIEDIEIEQRDLDNYLEGLNKL